MLAAQLAEGGRLTLAEVRDPWRKRRNEANAELPGELFRDREVAWQATARGHIVAALEAAPPQQRDGSLTQLLERALAEVEQA
jgi:hypothetical protein